MHGGDVDAIVKLLFIAQQTQNVGDQRAVNDKVILSEICYRFEARPILVAIFFNQWRSPRQRHRTFSLGGGGGGSRGRRGGPPPPFFSHLRAVVEREL